MRIKKTGGALRMKKSISIFLVSILVVSLMITGVALAEGNRHHGGGHHGGGNRPAQVQNQSATPLGTPAIASLLQNKQTVTGTVTEIRPNGYKVTLDNGTTIEVGFGPYWYLEKIGLTLNVGDKVTMTGVYYNNRFAPISVTVDGKTYNLRDASTGRPLWVNTNNSNNHGHGNNNKHGKGRNR